MLLLRYFKYNKAFRFREHLQQQRSVDQLSSVWRCVRNMVYELVYVVIAFRPFRGSNSDTR